jgi:hypothetical protein
MERQEGHVTKARLHYRRALRYAPNNLQAQQCLLSLTPQPAPSAPPETIDLQEWLLDNGASFPKICISAVVKDHRKISAVVPLQAHKEIICIPLRCCISYQTAVQLPLARHVLKDPAFDKVLSQDMAGCRSTDLLALYLLLDGSDTNSFHAPYYRSLPLHTANFPACWSEQELACLEGSNVLAQVRAGNCDMQATFEKLVEAEREMMIQGGGSSGGVNSRSGSSSGGGNSRSGSSSSSSIGSCGSGNSCQTRRRLSDFEFADWQRAKLLVISRNFRRFNRNKNNSRASSASVGEIENENETETNLMLPFIDMLNHNSAREETELDFDEGRGMVVLRCGSAPLEMDCEVHASYGMVKEVSSVCTHIIHTHRYTLTHTHINTHIYIHTLYTQSTTYIVLVK